MSKKDDMLKGGLSQLLGGSIKLQEEKVDEVQTPSTVTPGETISGDGTLLDQLEDLETRELILARRNRKRGRPKKEATPKPIEEEERRQTCIFKVVHLRKLQTIANSHGLMFKEVFQAMCEKALSDYENTYGVIDLSKKREYKRLDPSELFNH